jgi:hypothetical protein
VYRHLTGREFAAESLDAFVRLDVYRRELGYETIRRVHIPVRPAAERLVNPRGD